MTIRIDTEPKDLAEFLTALANSNMTVLTARLETLFNELEKQANSSCSAVQKGERISKAD